jgi:hypothetical protein
VFPALGRGALRLADLQAGVYSHFVNFDDQRRAGTYPVKTPGKTVDKPGWPFFYGCRAPGT